MRMPLLVALGFSLGAGLLPTPAAGQSDVAFPPQVYSARRERLATSVRDGIVVVPGRYLISPGDELTRQDPTFWYLTGVESPYAILVMARATGDAGNAGP